MSKRRRYIIFSEDDLLQLFRDLGQAIPADAELLYVTEGRGGIQFAVESAEWPSRLVEVEWGTLEKSGDLKVEPPE